MAKRKRFREFFEYECTLTGQKFRRYRKLNSTEDLVSVRAYYELHPEQDDRPDKVKRELEVKAEEEKRMAEMMDMFE